MTSNENIKKVILWLISQGIVGSQEQLAEMIGYNPSSVSQIVTGIRPLSTKFATKLCSFSEKINKDYLFGNSSVMILGDNNNQNVHNINGNGNKVNSETDKFLDLLRKKDEQIDRLLGILEKINNIKN